MIRLLHRLLLLIAIAAAVRAATQPGDAPVVLISIDGFRWDYADLFPDATPHLNRLRREGISLRGLIPPFPSNTFPGHYTLVTGLRPSRSGMLNNIMFDPALGQFFRYNQAAFSQDGRWWGGEPIWNTAVRQGVPSATYFWPGSEAEIGGRRPTYWKKFAYATTTLERRIEDVAAWLDLPPAERPAIITFYLEETNAKGHRFGPESPENVEAMRLTDGAVGALRERLERDGRRVNFVVVSDHGMTPVSLSRVIVLDRYLDPKTVQVDFDGTVMGLRPLEGQTVDAMLRALAAIPVDQGTAYAAKDLPEAFHIDVSQPRVPPVWIVPKEGWWVYRQSSVDRAPSLPPTLGDHGFDPRYESMHGILIAAGPAFRTGGVILDREESVHVYNLLCDLLRVEPAPNDGDDRLSRAMLAR